MKKNILIAGAVAIVATLSLSSCENFKGKNNPEETPADSTAVSLYNGKIVFYNADRVIKEYDMANDKLSAMETKVKGIENELKRRGNNLQSEMNTFNQKLEKGLLTQSVAEQQGSQLQKKQNDFLAYKDRKEQELAEEQAVTMRQIYDAINTFIQSYNEKQHYSMILATTSGAQMDLLSVPVTAGDPALDITDDIIKGLNEEYVKNKNKTEAADTTKATKPAKPTKTEKSDKK